MDAGFCKEVIQPYQLGSHCRPFAYNIAALRNFPDRHYHTFDHICQDKEINIMKYVGATDWFGMAFLLEEHYSWFLWCFAGVGGSHFSYGH